MNKVKYFINSYHTRIKAGVTAFALLITTGCTALVGPKNTDNDEEHNHTPGTTEVGGYDHDHEHEESPVIQEPVKNIEIEIKPGVIIEVDGSLFPNVDNLNNDEIKAILDDLEKEQKEQGKAPIVDPSVRELEGEKPARPTESEETAKNHKHKFGDWYSYSDEVEARECECGEIETQNHSYTLTKTSYATYNNGTHYEVDTMTCSTCGHKTYKAHKENCELRFQDYDEDYEYHVCDDCGYVNNVKHNLEIVDINDNNVATFECSNEGCAYTLIRDLTPEITKPNILKPIISQPGSHKHSFNNWRSLNDNLEVRACTECGKIESRRHDYKEISVTYENQGEIGHKRLTLEKCTNCNHKKMTKSNILGHNLTATNNSDGSTTYTCTQTGCGYTKTIQNTEHTTHDWVETSRVVGEPAGESTHYTEVTYTCKVGGEIKIEKSIEDCSMKPGSTSIAKYDEEYHWSETTGECECGNHLKNISDKVAHTLTTTTTYENKGDAGHLVTTEKKCACGYKSKTSNLANHALGDGVKNEDGSVTYKCTTKGCDYTKTVKKEHTKHDWKETGRSVKDSVDRDTHNVEISFKCSCGETKSEIITESCTMKPISSFTSYDSVYHWIETKRACECGNTDIYVTGKTTHDMGEWKPINDKQEQRTCTGCGYVEKRNIHTHSWIETGRTVKDKVGDSSHTVEITSKCSCGETKTETKTESCNMVPGETKIQFNTLEHWTETISSCKCGRTKTNITDKISHNMGDWKVVDGTEQRSCSGCGYTETKKHEHVWEEVDRIVKDKVGDSSHTVEVISKCSCGKTKTETKTESCNMVPGETKIQFNTLEHWTETISSCRCGRSKTEISNRTSHVMGEWKQINDKQEQRSCSGCGHTETRDYTPGHTHSYSEKSRTNPTPFGDNQHKYTITYACSCGATYDEVKTENCVMTPGHQETKYDATGHWTITPSSCKCGRSHTITGETVLHDLHEKVINTEKYSATQHKEIVTQTCSCGYSTTIDRYSNHTPGEQETITGHDGYCYQTTSYCTACGEKTLDIKSKEHTGEVINPSESQGLFNVYVCPTCGEKIRSELKPTHTHNPIPGDAVSNGESGHTVTYTCACGQYTDTKTELHDYDDFTIVGQNGYCRQITHTCKDCGYSYQENFTEHTGEVINPSESQGLFNVYVCPTCGEKIRSELKKKPTQSDDQEYSSETSTIQDDTQVDGVSKAFTGVKSVEDILASAKSVDDLLKDIPEVEDILAGTATIDDIIKSHQDKQNDQGDAYTIKPL